MTRFFRVIRMDEIEKAQKYYRAAGADVRTFPYSERGLNQRNFRKIEINPPTGGRQWDYLKATRNNKKDFYEQ